jgi:hypothetical protein
LPRGALEIAAVFEHQRDDFQPLAAILLVHRREKCRLIVTSATPTAAAVMV